MWQILVSQFAGRQKKPPTIVTTDLTYDELCDTHTDYHHAISIDLGKVVSPEVKGEEEYLSIVSSQDVHFHPTLTSRWPCVSVSRH